MLGKLRGGPMVSGDLLGCVGNGSDEPKVVDLVAAYESGVTGDRVGLYFGVSRWTVHRLVREHGGVVRRVRRSRAGGR